LKGNVVSHQKGSSPEHFVEILDESLSTYGFQPGDVSEIRDQEPEGDSILVWELSGGLHARHLEDNGPGRKIAWTPFLSGGKIIYMLDPEQTIRIKRVGWIAVKKS